MHHYARHNHDGARKLYAGHRQYLAGYMPAYRGLDVADFLAQMQRTLQPVVRARAEQEPPFELATAPRLEFDKDR